MKTMRLHCLCTSLLIGLLLAVLASNESSAQAAAPSAAAAPTQAPLKPEQLEQLLSPIALYPDALLAQVLMASTYPLEIVQAARWLHSNAGKSGKALEDALQKQPWDPSVRSLVAVPQVLQMMDQKLDWVQQVGDAFLGQRADVMDAVQRLRAKASAAGKLQTSKEQKVSTQTTASQTVIVIEPANPQVVYVPVYNPTVVYGAWPYPAYPPYAYYPPGYVAGRAIAFATGVAVGAALWGNFNWGRNEINININRYNSFNRTNITNTNWQHNSVHRRNVPYRDGAVAKQFGGSRTDAAARQPYRGRSDLQLGNRVSQPVDRSRIGAGAQPARRDRVGTPSAPRAALPAVGNRAARGGAFSNIDRGAAARANANRGRASIGAATRTGQPLGGGRR